MKSPSSFTTRICKTEKASSFSLNFFESLKKRAWQDQAEKIVKSKSLNAMYAKYLLEVAPMLEIEQEDVEPHLFTRLSNIEYLVIINQRQSISNYCINTCDEIGMESDEFLIWVFEETTKEEQQRYSENKQWSVFQSVIGDLFKKPRYKRLAVAVKAAGKLVATNLSLYYITKKETTKIDFAEIHSITPMEYGVRIQTTHRDATPDTYITGDGRFTYMLLCYIQGQKLRE